MGIIDTTDLTLATVFADKEGQKKRERGEEWSSAVSYKFGEYAEHDGKMYRCKVAHPASPEFNPENWIPCSIEVGDYVDYALLLLASSTNIGVVAESIRAAEAAEAAAQAEEETTEAEETGPALPEEPA